MATPSGSRWTLTSSLLMMCVAWRYVDVDGSNELDCWTCRWPCRLPWSWNKKTWFIVDTWNKSIVILLYSPSNTSSLFWGSLRWFSAQWKSWVNLHPKLVELASPSCGTRWDLHDLELGEPAGFSKDRNLGGGIHSPSSFSRRPCVMGLEKTDLYLSDGHEAELTRFMNSISSSLLREWAPRWRLWKWNPSSSDSSDWV